MQLIEPRALSKKGDYVKLTLRASSVSDASIDRIWISQPDPAGEPYDPDTDRMEFYGKVSVPANTAMTLSDTLPDVFYGLNQNKRLFIAFDFSGTPPWVSSTRTCRRLRPLLVPGEAYWHAGAEAGRTPRPKSPERLRVGI